jgi:7,8-dihydropterin-6-yl-methyl-4-(beta-D-ribofuranosyl)aminobenzene 5'-phosphate synthase
VKAITEAAEILPGIVSLGEMGEKIVEQSLLVSTDSGGVLLTGCAHPGVLDIVNRVIDYAGSPPHMILGGLHLKGKSERILRETVSGIRERGVIKAGPSHCTGDAAREVFEEVFGDGYIEVGAGSVVEVP